MRINIKDILEQEERTQLNTDTSERINVAEILGGGQPADDDAKDAKEAPVAGPSEEEPEPELEIVEEPVATEEVVIDEPEGEHEPDIAEEPVTAEEPVIAPEAEHEDVQEPELPKEAEHAAAEQEATEEPVIIDEPEAAEEPAPEPEMEEAQEPEHETAQDSSKGHFARFGAVYGNILLMALLIAFTIVYTTMTPRTVHAVINGEQEELTTTKFHVIDALHQNGFDYCEEDHLSVVPEAYVTDGMSIELIHAKDFVVTADGKTKSYKSLKETVGEALKDKKIKVGKIDIVEPAVDEELTDNTKIVIKRVVIKEETMEEDVDFETVTKEDTSMAEGKTKVVKEGKKGKDQVTYKITYTDGKETKRKELSRKHITKPVSEVVAKGTAVEFNGKLYKRKMTVTAYSYTGGGRTAMGTRARVGEIAVDPRVIPLGTTVYIQGVGERRAEDTGGNIKGKTIDIYMNSKSACRRWGRRTVTIYLE